MAEDADDPEVNYDSNSEMATFSWQLPDSGNYDQQQIGRRLKLEFINTFAVDFEHCQGHPYDECYDVNNTDTSATLLISQDVFESSDFDHLLLQVDDLVLATPFTNDSKYQGICCRYVICWTMIRLFSHSDNNSASSSNSRSVGWSSL